MAELDAGASDYRPERRDCTGVHLGTPLFAVRHGARTAEESA